MLIIGHPSLRLPQRFRDRNGDESGPDLNLGGDDARDAPYARSPCSMNGEDILEGGIG